MQGKIHAFGEIMLRLSADSNGIANSKSFEACYGGTEANVLACLSNLGHETKYLSALPKTELGKAALNHLNGFNIDTSDVIVQGDVLGTYFVENGNGSRGSNVIYNRRYSEFSKLDEHSFDADKVFGGVCLFHISGISFALSKSSRALAFRLIKEAKQRGIKVSFDFNYRPALWSISDAAVCFKQLIEYADIVLASPRDLLTFLQTDYEHFYDYYKNEYLILRNREVISAEEHCVEATVYHNGSRIYRYELPKTSFNVTEKIGGGDAFDGGIIHGIVSGWDVEKTLDFAISAFILKHKIKGDTFTLTEKDVIEFQNTLGLC